MKPKLSAFLLIFVVAFLAFFNILDNEFVWDDFPLIVESDALRSWNQIGAYFTTPFWTLAIGQPSPYFRPFVPLLILLTSVFSGTQPWGYHLICLLLHALASWLLYRILRELKTPDWLRWSATFLFVLHPVHVEAVAWASAIPIPFGTVVFLLAVLIFIKAQESKSPLALPSLLLVFFLYTIGLLSYEMTAALPLILLVYERHYRNINYRNILFSKRIIPYVGLAVIFAVWFAFRFSILLRFKVAGLDFGVSDPYTANAIYSGLWWEPFVRPLNVFSRYLELLIFPLVLTPDHYFAAESFRLPALACLLLFAGFYFYLRKHGDKRLLALGCVWLIAPLLPVLHFVKTGGQFADRYLYLPSVGFVMILSLLIDTLCIRIGQKVGWSWKTRYLLLLLPFLVFYGGKTVSQNQIWQNNLIFWIKTSTLSPQKPQPHNELGGVLYRAGYQQEALREFETAARIAPNYVFALNNLAVLHKELKNYDEADKYRAKVKALMEGSTRHSEGGISSS